MVVTMSMDDFRIIQNMGNAMINPNTPKDGLKYIFCRNHDKLIIAYATDGTKGSVTTISPIEGEHTGCFLLPPMTITREDNKNDMVVITTYDDNDLMDITFLPTRTHCTLSIPNPNEFDWEHTAKVLDDLLSDIENTAATVRQYSPKKLIEILNGMVKPPHSKQMSIVVTTPSDTNRALEIKINNNHTKVFLFPQRMKDGDSK